MDRRSTFRLRFPWSSASEPEPASKPATQPNTKSTGSSRTTRQGTRSQPSSSTRSKNSPSSSPANENSTPKQPPNSTTTAISGMPSSPPKAPSQPTTTSTSALPETLTTPPQPLAENKAPIESSTTNTKPTNGPASPKSETQTPTSIISQTPQSSPPGVVPSITESQPLIPSQEDQSITFKPASPSPSPSRPAPQLQEMSPKSSPTRNGPQVLSTDQLTPKAASPASGQTSSKPSDITSQTQQNNQTISQPTSPPKQSQDSSEISPKSTETLPSNSEKEPIPAIVKPQSEQMELLKKEGPSKISDSSRIISEPKSAKPLETNIPKTKEVKEVVQETTDKNYGAGEKNGGFLTSKEQPDIVFQSKQAYTNSDNDQIRVNRVSNGKQTRTISAEPDIPLNKEVKDNISKFINRMTVGDGKQKLEEGPVSVITLAGDNRGASMQLSSNSSRKGKAVHIHRGYKLNADETADAEGTSKGKQTNDVRAMKDQELEAYMNCNVQGLNNSITFDSTIEGKNPGIHMTFPRMPSEPPKTSDKTGLFEAHKAEYNVTRAQKHTYKPTIKRRCLEGLFVEPSDSDSDNPEKPRKHGCHVGGKKKRDNDIDIL